MSWLFPSSIKTYFFLTAGCLFSRARCFSFIDFLFNTVVENLILSLVSFVQDALLFEVEFVVCFLQSSARDVQHDG